MCWGPRSPVQPLGLHLGPGLRQAPLWALRTNSAGRGAFRAGTIARGHSGCWSRKGFIVVNCLQHCSPGLALTIPCMPTLGSWVPLQSPGYEVRGPVTSLAALAPGSSKGSLTHGSATGAEGHREGVPGHPREARRGCRLSSRRSSVGRLAGPSPCMLVWLLSAP